jgi:hypothetical protein
MTDLAGIIGWIFFIALALAAIALIYERGRKPCPECTSRIPKAARRCKHCSAEV